MFVINQEAGIIFSIFPQFFHSMIKLNQLDFACEDAIMYIPPGYQLIKIFTLEFPTKQIELNV